LHFWFITLWCLCLIIACIFLVKNPTWKELLIIPIAIIYVNFAEYIGHKGPMHHRKKNLDKVFIRHTLQHHAFFVENKMYCDSIQDFKVILFPPVLLIFFFVAFALPAGLLFYFLWSANAALIFVATIFGYYLNYEWLHLTYHLPPEHFISRLPIIKTLKRNHTIHHETQLMMKYNFNITYPIFDLIFGTLYTKR
jgi:hypothetical protein